MSLFFDLGQVVCCYLHRLGLSQCFVAEGLVASFAAFDEGLEGFGFLLHDLAVLAGGGFEGGAAGG